MRRKDDFYPTPAALTYALMDHVGRWELKGATVYEPCCGDGQIVQPLRKHYSATVVARDINPAFTENGEPLDATSEWPVALPVPDWIITNPPFNQASAIWQHCRRRTACTNMAFLLRLSFLEPVKEREWLRHSPPNELIVLPRTSFTADGKTDSVTCAWMIWYWCPAAHQPKINIYTKQELADLTRKFSS